jgi:hypothetical protein
VAGFEAFAYDFYESEGYPNLGMSDFGHGIYARDADSNRFHDTESPTHGTHDVLMPNLLAANIESNAPAIMLNIYSQESSFGAIDKVIDCAVLAMSKNLSTSTCYEISDIMWLVQDDAEFRPAGTIYYPLLPEQEDSASGVTGICYVLFNWDTIFKNSIPGYIEGLEVVLIHGEDEIYTYEFEPHGAIFHGFGQENADGRLYSHGKKVDISIMNEFEWPYTVILVPTLEYERQYRTNSRVYASVFSVGIVMITSALFFLYDYFITRGAREKELVINTRRLFVR